MLDKTQILQEIIDRDGDCSDFASPSVCKLCPLGNKIINGHRVNCMDYLRISEEMSFEQINARYLIAAEDEQFKAGIEDILSDE